MALRFEDNPTDLMFERAAVRSAVVALDPADRDILACHRCPKGLLAAPRGEARGAFRPRVPRFGCSCSPERIAAALELLGGPEGKSMVAGRGHVGASREFCNRRYELNAVEARGPLAAPSAAGHASL